MPVSPRRLFALTTAAGGLIGLLVAGLMLYIAWQHNPAGEFHEAGVVHATWFQLGLLYFAACLCLGGLVGAVLAFGARKAAAIRSNH